MVGPTVQPHIRLAVKADHGPLTVGRYAIPRHIMLNTILEVDVPHVTHTELPPHQMGCTSIELLKGTLHLKIISILYHRRRILDK